MDATKVVLESIRVRGYRSCVDTSISPKRDYSVLIGPNGAGKTNLLQAIRLLRAVGEDRRRYQDSEDPLASRCSLEATFEISGSSVGYRAAVTYTTNEKNQDQVIFAHEQWNFAGLGKKGGWYDIDTNFIDFKYLISEKHVKAARSNDRIFVGKRLHRLLFDPKIGPVIQAIVAFRTSISYYSASIFTDPARCPSHFEVEEDGRLRSTYVENSPHLRFLFALFQEKNNNPTSYSRYMSLVGKHGMALVDRIAWKEVAVSSSSIDVKPGGKLSKRNARRRLVIPSVHVGENVLSLNQLSEGTFKTLALLYYLITDKSQLLLIEEPEVCIHHGLLKSIVEVIKAYSSSKQILFSTHSDFVLDAVDHENVFAVSRSATGTSAKALTSKLGKKQLLALKEFLVSSGNLGEYWRQGGLDL